MKGRLSTLLIILVMILVGAMYWVDLAYYTDMQSGFVTRGSVAARGVILILPLLMCVLGLRTLGPRAISTMRMKSGGLSVLFGLASAMGMAYGATLMISGLQLGYTYRVVMGVLTIWYGAWMCLMTVQMYTQKATAPTQSAVFGILAAMPFVMQSVERIVMAPFSIHRLGEVVQAFSVIFVMLWFGVLLRSVYVALPRRRVYWMYLISLLTFLFATCLELPYTMHLLLAGQAGAMELFESVHMAVIGTVAGGLAMNIGKEEQESSLVEV